MVITSVLHISDLHGESGYWRVFFKDKGNEVITPGSNLWYKTLDLHSQKALDRRRKNNPKAQIITIADAPINSDYLNAVSALSDSVLLTLRWHNYIVIKTDSTRMNDIKQLSFVKGVQRTGAKYLPVQTMSNHASAFVKVNQENLKIVTPVDNCGVFRYGAAFNQATLMQIPRIHRLGITGKDAVLSFLDSGFRWKGHSATKQNNVIAEYDFIQKDSVTENQVGDVGSQDYHGSICYSTVSAFLQDSLIGIAPFASFILAKTEDIPTEQHLEEDNYAAAVEWSEALGADLISSSLGYSVFNQQLEENYVFDDYDGKTTITSRIVNEAVKRGVICVTAAGNDGPRDSTLITPSDADSVISVGALAPDGLTPANFTSRGPRADGKIKPDISAQGIGVACINPNDTLALAAANGTSLATPLIAGALGLMISAFPELPGYQLRKNLLESGTQAHAKDNILGSGLAKVHDAMLQTGILISPMITYPISQYQRIVYLIESAFPIINATIHVRKKGMREFISLPAFKHDTTNAWAIDLLKDTLDTVKYETYITVNDAKRQRVYPPRLPNRDSVHVLMVDETNIPCGIYEQDLPKHTYPMSVHDEYIANSGYVIPTTGQYQCSIYGLNGALIEQKAIELQEGNYAQHQLQQLFQYEHLIALMIQDKTQPLFTVILPPFQQ
jgi:subtilisin family serine protease